MAASSSTMRMVPAGDVALPSGLCASTAASDIHGLSGLHHREFKVEGCAHALLALHLDLSRVLLDDAVGHRKTETGATALSLAARGLGGEERIVDAVNVLLRN